MAAIAKSMPQASFLDGAVNVRTRRNYADWAPTAKVSMGALAGALTILISPFLGVHWKTWTQQDMTPAIGAAITNILTFCIQYWMPERKR